MAGFRQAYNMLKGMTPPTAQQMSRLKQAAMSSPIANAGRGIAAAAAVATGRAQGPSGKRGIKAGVQVLKNYTERNR